MPRALDPGNQAQRQWRGDRSAPDAFGGTRGSSVERVGLLARNANPHGSAGARSRCWRTCRPIDTGYASGGIQAAAPTGPSTSNVPNRVPKRSASRASDNRYRGKTRVRRRSSGKMKRLRVVPRRRGQNLHRRRQLARAKRVDHRESVAVRAQRCRSRAAAPLREVRGWSSWRCPARESLRRSASL